MKLFIKKFTKHISKENSEQEFIYFSRLLQILFLMVLIFSVLFYILMSYEGKEYSPIACVYWTLTVMTTLGFGDITFTTDLGRLFTVIVLMSGISVFLVMLPLSFTQYVAWTDGQKEKRIPRILPSSIKNHIIIVGIIPLSLNLAKQLQEFGFYCVFLSPDLQTATNLVEQGYNVMMGDYDDKTTYHNLAIERASMLLTFDSDTKNSNIIFSAREASPTINIIARAEEEASQDILTIAGSTQVFLFRQLLGNHLAQRVTSNKRCFTSPTGIGSLMMAEVSINNTSLVGKTLLESNLRESVGINVVGLWEKGHFTIPSPELILPANASLVLLGTNEQIELFNKIVMFNFSDSTRHTTSGTCSSTIHSTQTISEPHTIVIGLGRVGDNVVQTLLDQGKKVTVVDKKKIEILPDAVTYVHGDAAQIGILEKAGIKSAASLIITTNDDDANIYLTMRCRQLKPDIQLICRATLDKNVNILYRAGASSVLSLMSLVRNSIINILMPHKVFMLSEGLSLFRYTIHENLAGISIADSGIHQKNRCNIVAIVGKNGKTNINPPLSYTFLLLDELYIITDREGEIALENLYQATSL